MEYIKLKSNDGLNVDCKINNFEGEIIELTMNSSSTNIPLYVGKEITCSYSGSEFSSRILKKNEDKLYVYIPLFQENIPNDKRKNNRIEIELPGLINDYLNDKVYQMTPEKKVLIVDLSITGFGFHSQEQLKIDSVHFLYFNLNKASLKTKIIIKNENKIDDIYRYGSEIQAITKTDFEIIRKYFLINQLNKLPK